MTIRTNVRVSGRNRVIGNLERLGRSETISRMVGPGTFKTAQRGAQYARRNKGFNNITGRAQRSIMARQTRNPRTGRFVGGAQLVAGNARAFYFRFLEFGTRYIEARTTIQRATRFMRQIVTREVSRSVARSLQREVR